MLVYVASPYRATPSHTVEDNIECAKRAAIKLWQAGHTVICPHMNTALLDREPDLANIDWYHQTELLLERCDALYVVSTLSIGGSGGATESVGVRREIDYAVAHGIPVYYDGVDIPPLAKTELRCPTQCRSFMQTVMAMYRLHLKKNADYSPANILGTGEIGLVTRLWDKVARLLSLMGWEFTISESKYAGSSEPANESIEDTLLDTACYAVIGLLLRKGHWGK